MNIAGQAYQDGQENLNLFYGPLRNLFIAGQAYQDGQENRKTNGVQRTAEALEHQVMETYTHTSLDFQHWQLYRANWMSGYQSVEDVSEEQTSANTADDTMYTLVSSSKRGCYALDDPQHGRDLESGDSLAILLAGRWIEGDIEQKANVYAIEHGSRPVDSGYCFNARDGGSCGLCVGMKVRLG